MYSMVEQPGQKPLLTVAIPTWNRAAYLKVLVTALAPQIAALPEVELLISDNDSPDETQSVVEEAIAAGLRCRYIRNAINIEADPNFLQCFEMARGTYVWIVGDDDVVLPGSLQFIVNLLRRAVVELIYVTPFGFDRDVNEGRPRDVQPAVREYTSGRDFLRAVGLRGDLIMLSAVIFNKERIESEPHPAFTEGYNTNLLQMGWVFTALKRTRCAYIVEKGLLASCDREPRRGFDLVRTFALCWARSARLYLAPDKKLITAALDNQIYSWFPKHWVGLRRNPDNLIVDPVKRMAPLYGHTFGFWLFTWPLLAWPLWPARIWRRLVSLLLKMNRWVDRQRHPGLRGQGGSS